MRDIDVRSLLDVVRECGEASDGASFGRALAAGLRRLLGGEVASFVEILSDAPGWDAVDPVEARPVAFDTQFLAAHAAENPLIERALSHPYAESRTWSDFVSAAAIRRTELFNAVYRPMGIDHQIAVCLTASRNGFAGVSAERSGSDFSDRERRLLTLAGPYLQGARARAVLTSSLKRAAGLADPAVVCVDRLGRTIYRTGAAEVLLRRYCPTFRVDDPELPDDLSRWLGASRAGADDPRHEPVADWQCDGVGGSLRASYLPGVVEDVVVLVEQPARALSPSTERVTTLSSRQREVLGWVAQGCSNSEIAALLELSVRTVEKHLEQILERLGVANRTAAAAIYASVETPDAAGGRG